MKKVVPYLTYLGTRPPLISETNLYELHHRARLAIKPGITGMPKDPVMAKTIVTIDMAERIAAKYGVRTLNVLTGFKFIGEQIGLLEKQGKEDSYIFGMEESYGYLSGSYVRDKDGVNAAFLICEMFAYYASQGIGLIYYEKCVLELPEYKIEREKQK